MSDPDVSLTPAQQTALDVLTAGGTLEDAAQAAGVTVRTLHRWRTIGPLSEALERLAKDALAAARQTLSDSVGVAATVLAGIVADPTVPPATRLRASVAVLELAGITDQDTGTIHQPYGPPIVIRWPVGM